MKPREIRVDGEVAFVLLTRGMEAAIDAADVCLVDGQLWCALQRGRKVYAGRSLWVSGKSPVVLMHRLIMGDPPGLLVDHIDGDGLNNRRANLRLASREQNAWNAEGHADSRTGIKGVEWLPRLSKWRASICASGIRHDLGLFASAELASAAYRDAAERLHGSFARAK